MPLTQFSIKVGGEIIENPAYWKAHLEDVHPKFPVSGLFLIFTAVR